MKTWLDYTSELLGAFRRLESLPVYPPIGDLPLWKAADAFYTLDQLHSEEVEASIRYFSRNQTWPPLPTEELVALHFRFRFACESLLLFAGLSTTRLPSGSPSNDIPEPDEDIYEWALIDLWKKQGRRFFSEVLESFGRLAGGPPPTV
jgi:hypothetical protein